MRYRVVVVCQTQDKTDLKKILTEKNLEWYANKIFGLAYQLDIVFISNDDDENKIMTAIAKAMDDIGYETCILLDPLISKHDHDTLMTGTALPEMALTKDIINRYDQHNICLITGYTGFVRHCEQLLGDVSWEDRFVVKWMIKAGISAEITHMLRVLMGKRR